MAMMPPHRCGTCRALVTGSCPTCTRTADRRRGTPAERGYDCARWRHFRRSFLEQYPLCGDAPPEAPRTTDSVCRATGRLEAATVVDHIVPVAGADDPTFYVLEGLQALCERCHNAKRSRESRPGGKSRPRDRGPNDRPGRFLSRDQNPEALWDGRG